MTRHIGSKTKQEVAVKQLKKDTMRNADPEAIDAEIDAIRNLGDAKLILKRLARQIYLKDAPISTSPRKTNPKNKPR